MSHSCRGAYHADVEQLECYLIAPNMLIPLHLKDWWYHHLDNFTGYWWGNALCGIHDSQEMIMLWRMYHSDDLQLLNSYKILYDRNDE